MKLVFLRGDGGLMPFLICLGFGISYCAPIGRKDPVSLPLQGKGDRRKAVDEVLLQRAKTSDLEGKGEFPPDKEAGHRWRGEPHPPLRGPPSSAEVMGHPVG